MTSPKDSSTKEEAPSARQEGGVAGLVVYTIGHSTHPLEGFIGILQRSGITRVIDVRTIPRSRHNPQYNRENIARALRDSGIEYVHCAGLGGFRHPGPVQESVNKGWKSEAFRAYADYMQTDWFWSALQRAIELAREESVALMCAEAVPWHCHRSLIADALMVSGVKVLHMLDEGTLIPHRMTPFARVAGGRISYPKEPEQETLDRFAGEGDTELPGRTS
jgi:uncharacterized protein (DUF488 family)